MSEKKPDTNSPPQEAEAQKMEAFAKLVALKLAWSSVGLSSDKKMQEKPQKPTNIHVNLDPFYQ